jgi:hypothetical protein
MTVQVYGRTRTTVRRAPLLVSVPGAVHERSMGGQWHVGRVVGVRPCEAGTGTCARARAVARSGKVGCRRQNVCGAQHIAGSPKDVFDCLGLFPASAGCTVARRHLRVEGVAAFVKTHDRRVVGAPVTSAPWFCLRTFVCSEELTHIPILTRVDPHSTPIQHVRHKEH